MIKVTYYIGMNDKNTLRQELSKQTFIANFDEVFKDYTLIEAQGRFTNKFGEITTENSFVVTTFHEITEIDMDIIENNCNILKKELNQESILVEVSHPDVMFL